MTPNPGSDDAIAQGCKCPVISNGHGRRSDGRFEYVMDCPVHGARDEKEESNGR